MGKKGYGASGLVRAPFKVGYVRTFGKREARRYICNRCRSRFKPGEQGKQTAYAAYRHVGACPPIVPSGTVITNR